MDKDDISDIGIGICTETFSRMGYIFRNQPIRDYGIDAIVESKEDGYASGKLIGVQVKTGSSYLTNLNSDKSAYVFRGDMKHYFYWNNYCLPVIIILVDPDSRECYWQRIDKSLIVTTDKGWTIEVPKSNVLSSSSDILKKTLFTQSEYEMRFNTLHFSLEWMKAAEKAGSLCLEVNEWINKSSGKGDFKLFTTKDDTFDVEEVIFSQTYWGFGLRDYSIVIKDLFPWADISIDKDYYDYNMDQEWHKEYETSLCNFENELLSQGKAVPQRDSSIYPYENCAGEVDKYRLILKLNDLGLAFLNVERFLSNGKCYFLS